VVKKQKYADEVAEFLRSEAVAKSSSIYTLSPKLNDYGVLGVAGRLDYAIDIPITQRQPIILPSRHIFTELIVKWYHAKMRRPL